MGKAKGQCALRQGGAESVTNATASSIAFIECHDAQGAANLKEWFDNKWVLGSICLYWRSLTIPVTFKIGGHLPPSRTHRKAIPSARCPKVHPVILYDVRTPLTDD